MFLQKFLYNGPQCRLTMFVISEVSLSSSRNNTVVVERDISHACFLRITPALKGWGVSFGGMIRSQLCLFFFFHCIHIVPAHAHMHSHTQFPGTNDIMSGLCMC